MANKPGAEAAIEMNSSRNNFMSRVREGLLLGRRFQGILGVLFIARVFFEAAGVADEEVVFIDELDEVVGGISREGCRRQRGSFVRGQDGSRS